MSVNLVVLLGHITKCKRVIHIYVLLILAIVFFIYYLFCSQTTGELKS